MSWLINERGSLRARLIKLASIWFIISLVVISVFLTNFFSYASLTRFQGGIDRLLQNLYTDVRFDQDGHIYPFAQYDQRLSNPYSGLYWEIKELDPKGAVVATYRSTSLLNQDLSLPQKIEVTGEAVHYNGKGPLGAPLRLVYQYLIFKDRHFLFIAAEDSSKVGRDVTTFALITGSALLVMSLFSLLAIYIQVRWGLKPLYRLTDELRLIQQSEQSRLVGQYPEEIMPVATQINHFLDYNQEIVERQRTHVGNLAHALKTPLSVLMTSANDGSELSEAVIKQSKLMREHVDRHLRRARAAARSQTLGERTEVEPVMDEMAVMFETVFKSKAVMVDYSCSEGLYFAGEKQDFQEILGNLLENACIWSQGKVRLKASVETALGPHKGLLRLDIEDNGPGLAPERFEEVLRRGARLDESSPGSGLGLSIVDELVRAYKGSMVFDRSALGGLWVQLFLPLGQGLVRES